jgi:RimJ/RimL family protein N-acetyltransferase
MKANVFAIRVETARLLLRPTVLEDFDAWAEIIGDEETARFIGGVQPRALAWRSFLAMAGAWQLQGFAMFSVVEKASGRCIGRMGPWRPEGWPGTEVGWAFSRHHWGCGYATEAGVAAIDWAFETLGWTEVIHSIDPDNDASIALAERFGSTYCGPVRLPEPYADSPSGLWKQTREQWSARRADRACELKGLR